MKSKKLPNGFELPVLAIGTNLMGGEDYGPPDYSSDEKYIKAIQDAIKLGYTHVDTAEISWWWNNHPPKSTLGLLRLYGLIVVGKMPQGSKLYKVAMIPKDLQEKLAIILQK